MNSILRNLCHVLILMLILPALAAQSDNAVWWKDRPLRIYHPNMRELEVEDFDVDRFIKDCKDLHAEAIVFSTGGPYAFYDTKVPHHLRSPHMGDRDLLREVIEEAKLANIRVIARLDFSITNQDVFDEREEWFFFDQSGIPVEKKAANGERFYRTRLLEGYRNEEVAFKVLHEVFSNYELDGVHLNSPGFQVKQFTEETMEKHGIPKDPEKQKQWRKNALHYRWMNTGVSFTATAPMHFLWPKSIVLKLQHGARPAVLIMNSWPVVIPIFSPQLGNLRLMKFTKCAGGALFQLTGAMLRNQNNQVYQ